MANYSLLGDGLTGYVSCPFSHPSSITVVHWFKGSGSLSANAVLSDSRVNGGAAGIVVYIDTSGRASVIAEPSGGSVAGITNLLDGNWHCVVYTYDGSTVALYVDGTSIGSHAAASSTSASTLIYLQADYVPSVYSPLYLAETFFCASILTATQIAQIAARTLTPAALATINLYAFTDGSGTTLTDSSGNGRNGTIHGTDTWEAANPFALTVTPASIPNNHAGNITLTLTGNGTSWNNSTTIFTPSGVTGVAKVSQNVTSATAATLVLTTGSGTGTLTITESVTGSNTATLNVANAAPILYVSAANVDGAGGFGSASPVTTTWHDLGTGGTNGTLNNWTSANTQNSSWSSINSTTTPCALNNYNTTTFASGTNCNVSFGNINGGVFPISGTLEIWYSAFLNDGGTNHRNLFTTGSLSNTIVANNGIRVEQISGGINLNIGNGSDGGQANSLGSVANSLNTDIQLVIKWNQGANHINVWVNGVQVLTNTSQTEWPTGLSLTMFCGYVVSRTWQGNIRIGRIYGYELLDSQIQANYQADAHPIIQTTYGTNVSYTPPDSSYSGPAGWTNSSGTWTYSPELADSGTIQQVPFTSATYGTIYVNMVVQRNWSALTKITDSISMPANSAMAPFPRTSVVSGGNYQALVQVNPSLPSFNVITAPVGGNLQTWSAGATGVLPNTAQTWKNSKELIHPTITNDNGTYVVYYCAGNNPSGQIGVATTTDFVTFTDSGSNPLTATGISVPGAWKASIAASKIYVLATKFANYFSLYTAPTGSPASLTYIGQVMTAISTDWDYGNGYYEDSNVMVNPYAGNFELVYTSFTNNPVINQLLGSALSIDGFTWFKYAISIYSDGTPGTSWVGDGNLCIQTGGTLLNLTYDVTNATSGGLAQMAAFTAPSVTGNPSPATVNAGSNTSFTASASGSPSPTAQWQVSTDSGSTWGNVSNGGVYSGATTGTLSITGATSGMNGYEYRAVFTNLAGTATTTAATLTVTSGAIVAGLQSGPILGGLKTGILIGSSM